MSEKNIITQPQRYCKYIHRYCFQNRVEGYDYCIQHILEDKAAPFIRCSYELNDKRCSNAVPIIDKNETILCSFHVKQSRIRERHHKKKPAEKGAADLMRHHYRDDSKPLNVHKHPSIQKAIRVGGPYSDLKKVEKTIKNNGEVVTEASYIENLDDDAKEMTFHYLQHAGVFTEKEVCIIAREKLQSLQRLYCEELKMLYHGLKEARREYLRSLKTPTTSLPVDLKKSPEFKSDATLQAYSSYPHCSGVEKIMRKRARDKQAGVHKFPKPSCIFEENGFTCTQPAIVFSKFCKTHVLHDPNQVLFVQCQESLNCMTPVIPLEEKAVCDYHFDCKLSKQKAIEEQPSMSDLNQPSCSYNA